MSGFAAFNYVRQNSPSGGTSSNSCSNGASNFPSCNVCPSGQTYDALTSKCYIGDFEISATQFPSSTPAGTVIQSTVTITPTNGFTGNPAIGWTGSGISVCDIRLPPLAPSNSAIITCGGEIAFWSPRPGAYSLTVTGTFGSLSHSANLSFSFFTPSCSNGATNYPQCTTFTTVTTVTCAPTTITAKLTSSSCTATVSSTLSPASGKVTFTFSQTWAIDVTTCTIGNQNTSCSCVLSGGSCTVKSVTDFGICTSSFTVYAQYDGDTHHQSSSGQFTLDVACPPSTVTVSGFASVSSGNTPYQIQFVNASGVGYTAAVNNGGTNSGSYSISLPNLQTYQVTVYYNSLFGTRTCSGGTLNLQSATNALTVSYSC